MGCASVPSASRLATHIQAVIAVEFNVRARFDGQRDARRHTHVVHHHVGLVAGPGGILSDGAPHLFLRRAGGDGKAEGSRIRHLHWR